MMMKKYNKIGLVLILIGQMVMGHACSSGIEDELTIKKDPDRYETSNPDPDPDPEPNPSQAKPLPQELAEIARSNNIPGVQIAHIKGDQVDSYVYGVADIASGTPVREDHLFQAASISKTVATYAFLRLYDKGVFDLDVPLNQYYIYDRVARANNPKNDLVTARHVLAHLTGYPNWVMDANTLAWRNSVLEPGAAYTPGVDYRYSGEGFTYLQEVLKHLTGKSLQQIAKEEVFDPFGMASTSYQWESTFAGKNTIGHTVTDGVLRMMTGWGMMGYTQNGANSAYSMLTNAKDFAKFVKRGLIDGEGLKPETYALLSTTITWSNGVNNPNMSRGLGMVIHNNEKGMSLYHSGSNPGYIAYCIAYPDLDEGLVVFTNGNPEGRAMGGSAFSFFLGADQTFHMFE
ncbi:beta-lactamase family protein [Sphingobacterium sp. SGG-5]|uniref:serine hydrolase domain-containing protein n=1 Tax=Sphingobacterium sp. SGG-5 TaxID=2710881 RepID=UPI0013ED8EA0|nr:serine hydrolase domain-containing protein [Sphingobacterium sp. SGG-5]NGM60667.1 beta-lactamase family protein [Sphingobacterium sp. SGG-5]